MFSKKILVSLMIAVGGFSLVALNALASPISQVPTAPSEPAAPPETTLSDTYVGTLSAASGPGREVTLSLKPGGLAEMTTSDLNGESPIVEAGIWRTSGGTVVRVTFDERNGEPLETTSDIIFRVINGNLVAVVYDRTVYGSAGLVLEPRSGS